MRAAPRPLSKNLPKLQDIAAMIQHRVVDRPDIRLGDYSIGQLVEELGDGTPTWLTGSNVWMPAMFGEMLPEPSDYDIVFATQAAATRFLDLARYQLNRRLPPDMRTRYELANNKFGSGRLLHPNGTILMDVWSLGDSETIGEVLMGYPHAYQRAAYYLSRTPSPGCIFRIANDGSEAREAKDKKPSIFSRIARSRATSTYPGRMLTAIEEEPPRKSVTYKASGQGLLSGLKG